MHFPMRGHRADRHARPIHIDALEVVDPGKVDQDRSAPQGVVSSSAATSCRPRESCRRPRSRVSSVRRRRSMLCDIRTDTWLPPALDLRVHDGLDDIVVARTAAEVAFKFVPNGLLIRVGMAATNIDPSHHHARRTKAALQSVVLFERGLHRVQVRSPSPAPRWS